MSKSTHLSPLQRTQEKETLKRKKLPLCLTEHLVWSFPQVSFSPHCMPPLKVSKFSCAPCLCFACLEMPHFLCLREAAVPRSLMANTTLAFSISHSQSLFFAQISHDTPSLTTLPKVAPLHCLTVFYFLAFLCLIIRVHYLKVSGDFF